jgi:rubrerythrin
MKRFAELSEQEILALAISSEEEDNRIYRSFAEALRERYAASAKVFDGMADEEGRHRSMLFDLYRSKFGEHLPLIRRHDVKGFVRHKPLWLVRPLGLEQVRKYAENMEYETGRFYRKAAQSARDASVRELLDELAEAEEGHESLAHKLGEGVLTKTARAKEDETARRMFMLQYVQPGLAGLMDGSVSTLAPLFAAAFATHNTWQTFLVGIAASVGAGISMAFAEALSDDGSLTGRGAPVLRGAVTGAMTHRHHRRGGRGRGGTRAHLLHPPSLHGYAFPHGGVSGRGRRRTRFSGRHCHRQCIVRCREAPRVASTQFCRTNLTQRPDGSKPGRNNGLLALDA